MNHLPLPWKDWEIVETLGTGSYGSVYKAKCQDQYAAIKLIEVPYDQQELDAVKSEYSGDEVRKYFENRVESLMTEIRALEQLRNHKNIVRMEAYEVEKNPDKLSWKIYIRMELLTPLMDYLGQMEVTEDLVIQLGISICSALEQCRAHGIVHRDIKPQNIMVSKDGTFKLGDFGVARDTSLTSGTVSLKGSYTYMAPEIFHGKDYTEKVDQYSLGLVLYKLLNRNRDPFVDTEKQLVYFKDKEHATKKRMAGMQLELPCQASENMGKAILKACAFDPYDRFENVSEMKRVLEKLQKGLDITIHLDKRRSRIRRIRIASAAIAALAVVAIIGGTLHANKSTIQLLSGNNHLLKAAEDADRIDFAEGETEAFQWSEELLGLVNDSKGDLESVPAASGYDSRSSNLIYESDDFCMGQVVNYSLIQNDKRDLQATKRSFDWYKLVEGQWVSMETQDDDLIVHTEDLYKSYLPDGYLQALGQDRNTYLTKDAFYLGIYQGQFEANLVAAWQNEDGSMDCLVLFRNGCAEDTSASSYLLSMKDPNLGEILLARGKYKVEVAAGEVEGRILHFDSVLTGMDSWTYGDLEVNYKFNNEYESYLD